MSPGLCGPCGQPGGIANTARCYSSSSSPESGPGVRIGDSRAIGKCELSPLPLSGVDSRDTRSAPCSTASSHGIQLVRATVTREAARQRSPPGDSGSAHVPALQGGSEQNSFVEPGSIVTASHGTPSCLSGVEGPPGQKSPS